MKKALKTLTIMTLAVICLAFTPGAKASDLTYSTLTPQTSDSDLVMTHKMAVAIAQMADALASGTSALIANGGTVDLIQVGGTNIVTGAGTAAGAIRVELPTDGTGKIGINAGTAAIGTVAITGDSKSNITATGTTSLTSVAVLDRLIINKAGTSDSQLVLSDGTNAFATVTTAAQVSLPYGLTITTGTLKLVNTGTTSADVTVGYR